MNKIREMSEEEWRVEIEVDEEIEMSREIDNKFDSNNDASNECENERIFLNLLKFTWRCLNLLEFT